MNLIDYIEQNGIEHCVNLWGCSQRSVYSWKDGTQPNLTWAVKILDTTPVTLLGLQNREKAKRERSRKASEG